MPLYRGHRMTAVGSPTSGNVAVSMTTGWTGTAPQAGDQLVAYVMTDDGTATIGAPAGWSSIAQVATGSDIVSRLLWLADATGIASSVNFPVSGTQGSKVLVVAINPNGETLSGTGTPEIAATVNSTTATTPVEAGVANPSIRLSFFADDSSFTVSSAPAGMTLLALNNANACSLVGYYEIDGGTGDKQDTVTWSGLDGVSAGIIILSYTAGGGGSPVDVEVPAASLALTGYAPTASATANIAVEIPAASLALTGYAPSVDASADIEVTVPAASLGLTGYAPSVSTGAHVGVVVPAASLTVTGYAPTVAVTAHVAVTVPVAALSLTAYAPSVGLGPISVTPPPVALTLTAYAPTVSIGAPGPDIDFAVTLYIRRDLSGTEAVRLDYASTETIRQNLASQELV